MAQTESFQHSPGNDAGANNSQTTDAALILSNVLGQPVNHLERIGGSRNSQVYKLTCADSNTYAAKLYFHHPADDRRRLDAEFSGLRFMWDNGLRSVPEPIAADRPNGCGVYEYIDGVKILPGQATASDVDAAADFLVQLKGLRNADNSSDLPLAAEACFSIQAIVSNIRDRFNRLMSLGEESGDDGGLLKFLTGDFAPTFKEAVTWCEGKTRSAGQSFNSELPTNSRTLSPSDFGFHNALKRTNSELAFVDFEYFGWDDPAKMISDFLIHPASKLSEDLRHRFAGNIISQFEGDPSLADRVEAVYPLFGLKWCLIILNEFLPEDTLRRGFIDESGRKEADVRGDCMERAKTMFTNISQEYRRFSYFD